MKYLRIFLKLPTSFDKFCDFIYFHYNISLLRNLIITYYRNTQTFISKWNNISNLRVKTVKIHHFYSCETTAIRTLRADAFYTLKVYWRIRERWLLITMPNHLSNWIDCSEKGAVLHCDCRVNLLCISVLFSNKFRHSLGYSAKIVLIPRATLYHEEIWIMANRQ